MENWSSLKFAFIVHRDMGCADESSTDEEQAEKILFSYPYDLSLYSQLTKINMLEGLIEFTNKFSSESLDTAVMETNTWGFLECEPNIWIMVAVDNGANFSDKHRPNSCGIKASLLHLYTTFSTFHGSLISALGGINGNGWENLASVQSMRKHIRKLGLKLRQQHQDLDILSEREKCSNNFQLKVESGSPDENIDRKEEYIGIRSSATTKEQIELDIAVSESNLFVRNQKLFEMLNDRDFYVARMVRETLSRFMRFYLSVTSMDLMLTPPSCFSGLQGMEMMSLGVAPACNSSLNRVRRAVEQVVAPWFTGSMLLCEGQVAWSDLDSGLTRRVAEFVVMQDVHALRGKAASLLEFCGGDSARSKSNQFQVTDSEIEGFISQRMGEVLNGKHGFVKQGWETLDLSEDVLVNNLLTWGGAGTADVSDAPVTAANRPMGDTDVLSECCLESSRLYCPNVYTDGACVGRMLFYKQNRITLALLIPIADTISVSRSYLSQDTCRAFLGSPQQPNDRTSGEKRNQIKVSQFLNQLRTIASAAEKSPLDVTNSKLCNRSVSQTAVSAALLLALCAVVQHNVSSELLTLERGLKVSMPGDANRVIRFSNRLQSNQHFSHSSVAVIADSASSSAPARSSSPVPGGGGGAGGATGQTNTTSISSTVNGSFGAGKDVKVIFYNSTSCTLQMSGVCREGESSPLADIMTTEGRSLVLSQLRQRDTHKNKVIGLVSDRLRDEIQGVRFPLSCGRLMSGLDPAVVRALNDIWVELAGRQLSTCSGSESVVEACLRVSTAHRGGVWVTGRRIGSDRYLYMVVDRCPTLNDMYEVFEELSEQLQTRSLMI